MPCRRRGFAVAEVRLAWRAATRRHPVCEASPPHNYDTLMKADVYAPSPCIYQLNVLGAELKYFANTYPHLIDIKIHLETSLLPSLHLRRAPSSRDATGRVASDAHLTFPTSPCAGSKIPCVLTPDKILSHYVEERLGVEHVHLRTDRSHRNLLRTVAPVYIPAVLPQIATPFTSTHLLSDLPRALPPDNDEPPGVWSPLRIQVLHSGRGTHNSTPRMSARTCPRGIVLSLPPKKSCVEGLVAPGFINVHCQFVHCQSVPLCTDRIRMWNEGLAVPVRSDDVHTSRPI